MHALCVHFALCMGGIRLAMNLRMVGVGPVIFAQHKSVLPWAVAAGGTVCPCIATGASASSPPAMTVGCCHLSNSLQQQFEFVRLVSAHGCNSRHMELALCKDQTQYPLLCMKKKK